MKFFSSLFTFMFTFIPFFPKNKQIFIGLLLAKLFFFFKMTIFFKCYICFQDLNNEGLKATDAVVVVDREQGGTQNLKEKGVKMHVLITLSEIMNILLRAGKITEKMVEDVKKYTSNTQINIDGSFRVANLNGN